MTLAQRVPQNHSLQEIHRLTDMVLVSLSDEFNLLYSVSGRSWIALEYVLRALLLQAFYWCAWSGGWSSSWNTTCCSGLRSVEPCGVLE